MSITASEPKRKSEARPRVAQQRFNQATHQERRMKIEPVVLSPEQSLMSQLLPASVLTGLARKWNASDVRQRKLTVTMFFWLTVLAVGPGGPISLHKVLTYVLVASVMSGVGAAQARLSKEAVSENFCERPWRFFEAVLQYLSATYAAWWRELAGHPNLAVVQELHVRLVDATVMRVAHQLISVFPASPNGKCKEWAAVKLHTSFHLFRGVPDVLALTPQKKHERKISFLRPAGEAVLYIFDLGYWTYELFDTIMDQHQHFISRMKANCNPLILEVYVGQAEWVGKRLKDLRLSGGKVDCLVNVSSANPANPRMQHNVRLVGQWIRKDQTWHLYLTSLVAWHAYPLTLIIDLYRLRWHIEILFRDLKHVLRIQNFVSITENGIRIQMYAALIHYMLTHLMILKAVQETGRPFEDFSIPYCLEAVQQVLQQTTQLILKGHAPDWNQVEALLLQAVIALGVRPNRKRKPLITKVKARLRRTAPLPA